MVSLIFLLFLILLAFIEHIRVYLVMASFICEQCGKSLTLATNLSRNKKVHRNGDFTCSNCSLKFSSEKSLEEHRRLIHLVSLASPESFCCETCGKEFRHKKNMLRHQNIHLLYFLVIAHCSKKEEATN